MERPKIVNCGVGPSGPEYITTKEVAALLRCSVRTVWTYINDGLITPRRMKKGGMLLFRRSEIVRLLESPHAGPGRHDPAMG